MALGWLTFLSPPLAAKYPYPYILVAAIGEGLLTLWLLVMGVNAEAWKEQAVREGRIEIATRDPYSQFSLVSLVLSNNRHQTDAKKRLW